MEDTSAAISNIAASLEAASATSDASTADTASTDSGDGTTSADASGAVDIPSGEPATEVVAEPAQEVAEEETQDPNVPQGHMPLHRHKAVLTKARNEGIAAAKLLQDQLESLKWAQQPDMPDRLKALEIAEANPELFVQVLKQDPRYAKLLTPEQPVAQQPKPQAPALGDRPGPDMQAENGGLYYSPEQATALQEWVERANEDRVNKMLEARFAPIEQERKEQQAVKEQQQLFGQARERQSVILTDARSTWPLFNELEAGMKADLAANKTMSLETAYRRAFTARTQTNRDAMRKEILAELNNRPPVAASTRPGTTPAVASAPLDMEAKIMEIAKRLERGA